MKAVNWLAEHALGVWEYTGMALGILNVLLAARGNIWCWLTGIISSAIYVYLNFVWQLPFDGTLQAFYVVAGFYGWWKWTRKTAEGTLHIVTWPAAKQLPLLLLGAVSSAVLGSISYTYFNPSAITFFDASLTIFSFIATWMMAKKVIDNWIWWVVIDTAGIGLYCLKAAWPTAILYLVLTLGACYAYYNWKHLQQEQKP